MVGVCVPRPHFHLRSDRQSWLFRGAWRWNAACSAASMSLTLPPSSLPQLPWRSASPAPPRPPAVLSVDEAPPRRGATSKEMTVVTTKRMATPTTKPAAHPVEKSTAPRKGLRRVAVRTGSNACGAGLFCAARSIAGIRRRATPRALGNAPKAARSHANARARPAIMSVSRRSANAVIRTFHAQKSGVASAFTAARPAGARPVLTVRRRTRAVSKVPAASRARSAMTSATAELARRNAALLVAPVRLVRSAFAAPDKLAELRPRRRSTMGASRCIVICTH